MRVGVLLAWMLMAFTARGDELLLSDFSNRNFGWTYGGFVSQAGPTATRLYDPLNGWGGAGMNAPLDLSSLADARLVVDFTVNPAHGADFFQVQLNDLDGLSGRYVFNTSTTARGELVSVAASRTLAMPNSTYDSNSGAFVDTPPDLSRIKSWAIEGQWQSPALFDISFDNLLVSTQATEPPPYHGYEPDAPWRAVASQRIDSLRKADLAVSVVDALGNPVSGATVGVQQTGHEFGFGSAVRASMLRDDSPQHATYKAKVAQMFNIATLENNLKWPAWEGQWGSNFTQQGADAALDWLVDHGIEARGHVMVWPGASHLPTDLRTMMEGGGPYTPAQQQQIRDRVAERISEIGAFGEGRITAWDVVNEPRANHDLMDALPEGNDAMIDWFQQAAAAAPSAKLYLNEYNILASGGATDSASQNLLEDQLRALIAADAPVGGVGLQGHFDDDSLTGPEQLWRILDRYTALGLDIQVTEFDYSTPDEALQAAYLRDFYTAMFAHEGVSDVLMWGFWENAHGRPDRAIIRSDWSNKPAADAYVDLVFNEWWTDESASSDAGGEVTVRAFKGSHDIDAAFGGATATSAVVLSDGGESLTLMLDFILGDYNRDGAVDAADYTLWRDTQGQPVAQAGMGADGDGDGFIGPGDYRVWLDHYGVKTPAVTTVPEPSALGVAIGAVLVPLGAARRSRRQDR